MKYYYFFNKILKSNIHIPELRQMPFFSSKSFSFSLEKPCDQLINLTWAHEWEIKGVKNLLYGKQNSYHVLSFPGLADFKIVEDKQKIYCHPLDGIPEHTIRHLLLDQVLPRYMAQLGDLVLHVSAVQTSQGLILFTGQSGAGKSTLAGYFHQCGYTVVSDDCVMVEDNKGRIEAIPSYGGVRLWKDSQEFLFPNSNDMFEMAHYSSKQRIKLEGKAKKGNQKIIAIFFLITDAWEEQDMTVKLGSISVRDGYMELLRQTYKLDLTDAEKIARHAKALGRIALEIPMFNLRMPRDYVFLPLAKELILDTVMDILN